MMVFPSKEELRLLLRRSLLSAKYNGMYLNDTEVTNDEGVKADCFLFRC